MNLIQSIYESALQRLEKPAVDFEGVSWTYRDFMKEIERHAGALSLLGIREGDRVAFQLPKCPGLNISIRRAARSRSKRE